MYISTSVPRVENISYIATQIHSAYRNKKEGSDIIYGDTPIAGEAIFRTPESNGPDLSTILQYRTCFAKRKQRILDFQKLRASSWIFFLYMGML